MTNFYVETTRGTVILSTARETLGSRRPVVMMLHGAFGNSSAFYELASRLTDVDAVFGHLSDHDGPSLDEISVHAYVDAFSQAIRRMLPNRRVIAVGESLGGLIALGLPVAAVVAFDPPLTTSGREPLLHAHASDPKGRAHLGRAYFGDASGGPEYWPLLEQFSGPVYIVTGDIRASAALVSALLDESDLRRLRLHERAHVEIAPGLGHVILREKPGLAHALVERAVRESAPA